MTRKYSHLHVKPPEAKDSNYRYFENSKRGSGDKENPSALEKNLPKDWKEDGWARDSQRKLISVTYIFPEHIYGLAEEEVLSITSFAYRFGAASICFESFE